MATGTTTAPNAAPKPAGKLVEYNQYIDGQLRRTRGQVKAVELAGGFMTLLAATVAFFLVAALLDHWILPRGLGYFGRTLAFAVFAGGAIYFFVKVLWPAIVGRVNPVYAAQAIERSKPSLKNSLINFLLFRQRREAVPQLVYSALEEQAATNLSRVPVEIAVDRTRLIHIGYVLVGLVAAFAVYFLFSPKDPLRTLSRVVLPWADIAAPARVNFDDIQPGNGSAFRGQGVQVSAEVRGLGSGDNVRLIYSTTDRQIVDRAIPMHIASGGYRHAATLPEEETGLQQDVYYRLEAGDAVSGTYRITTSAAPTIVVERVEYQFPKYTGMAAATVRNRGDLKALEGTQVTLHARANGSLKSASLDWNCDGRADRSLKIDGLSASIAFPLEMNDARSGARYGSYQLMLVNELNQTNPQPVRHTVEVLPDLPPEVKFIQPQQDDVTVAADGQLPLELRAIDPDFALAGVTLHLQPERNGAPTAAVNESLLRDGTHVGPLMSKYALVPAKLGLKEGDVVRYRAAATDNKSPQANQATTHDRVIRIGPAEQRGNGQRNDQVANNDQQPMQEQGDKGNEGEQSNKGEQQGEKGNSGEKGNEGDKGENGDKGNEGEKGDQGDSGDKGDKGDKGESGNQGDKGDKGESGSQSGEKSGDKGNSKGGGSGEKSGGSDSKAGESGEKSGNSGGNSKGDQSQGDQSKGNQSGDGKSPAGEQGSKSGDGNPQNRSSEKDPSAQPNGENGEQSSEQSPGSGTRGGQRQPMNDGPPPADGTDDGKAIEQLARGGEQESGDRSQENKQQPGDGQERGNQPNQQPGADGQQPSGNQAGEKNSEQQPGGNQQPGANQHPSTNQQQPSNNQQPGANQQPGNQPNAGNEKSGTQQQPGAGNQSQDGDKTQQPKGDGSSKGGDGNQTKPGDGGAARDGQQPDKAGPEKPQDGKQPDLNQKPEGGDAESRKGNSGDGGASKDGSATPMPQENATPTNKTPDGKNPMDEKSGGGDSPSNSKRESNSKGGQDGDRSGGGQKGGGQDSDNPGLGSAGKNTAAEDGAGTADEPGAGDPSKDKAGNDQKADEKTGQPGGNEKGPGSSSRPSTDPNAKQQPGTPPQGKPQQGDPKGPPQDGKATDFASQPGGNGNSGGDTLGAGSENTSDAVPQGKATAPDDPNLNYAKKATEMALERLKNAMKIGEEDSLLKQLGWSRAEAEQFIARQEQRLRNAQKPNPADAARREAEDALRSLGLRPPRTDRTGAGLTSDNERGLSSGRRTSPPPEYAEQFKAFRQGVNQEADQR